MVLAPRRRVLMIDAVALVLLVLGTAGLFFERQLNYDRNVERIPDAFPPSGPPSTCAESSGKGPGRLGELAAGRLRSPGRRWHDRDGRQ